MLDKQCGRCKGTGYVSNPDTGTIGCSLCAGCYGSGKEPEVKVHILSAEVTLHDKPRYIAWPTGNSDVHGYKIVEVARANGFVSRHPACSIMWDFYRDGLRHLNKDRFIAYRVIEQEGDRNETS
jgi:hypothetical protein